MATNREILEQAQTSLAEEGWRQHGLGPSRLPEPHCAVGAIGRAQYLLEGAVNSTSDYEPVRLLHGAVYPEAHGIRPYASTSVELWNDTWGRTKEQVLDALKAATKLAIAQEEQA